MSGKGIRLPLGDGKYYNYKRPNCTLENLIQEYILSYSCTTMKRTGAYGGSAPVGITKILQSIVVSSNRNKEDYIQCGVIMGELNRSYKTNLGTHENLCRLSVQPFPLIQTGKQTDKHSEKLEFVPLYDESTGQFAAERYSHVRLSRLGEIAFKDYYDTPVDKLKFHKGIVPIALLRKGLAWALGHHSTMYSMNPQELFRLQERMLELNTPYLPNEVVLDIFRGPDLGNNYTIYMTNESLGSLYASGTGSMMVVPNIEIDRVNNQIKFLRPPLDTVGTDFSKHLIRRLIGGEHGNKSGGKTNYEQFETISFNPKGDGAFISGSSIIADVIFNTTNDREIIDELHSDREIYRNVPLQNILLKTRDGDHIQTDEEDLDSTADFEIDVVPIYEVLWEHIEQEIIMKRKKYIKKYNDLQNRLKWDIFLEKVTRPEISNAIMNVWNETHIHKNTHLRKNILREMFTFEETRDINLLPEGFNDEEIDEICRKSSSKSNTGLVIINIMSEREKYSDQWMHTLNESNRLKNIIDDTTNVYIREEIRRELEIYTGYKEFQRKSKMYFIEPIGSVSEEISTLMIPRDEVWNKENLPCTLYYSGNRIVKSYGRNFNIMPSDDYDVPENYKYSLNVTNDDYIIIFGDKPGEYYFNSVRDYSSTPSQLGVNIQTIVPYPKPGEKILLNIREFSENNGKKINRFSILYVLDGDNPVIPSLKSNNDIISYAYLDKKYVQMSMFFKDRIMVSSVETSDIIENTRENPMKITKNGTIIVDLMATDEFPNTFNLSQNGHTDVLVTSGSLTKWNKLIPNDIEANKNGVSSPYFVKHMEFYAEGFYNPWLQETFVLSFNSYVEPKILLLNEPHYCHPKDTSSKKIKQIMGDKIRSGEVQTRVIMTNKSKAYQDYTLDNISDWGLIDSRYRIPTDKPEDKSTIESFNKYFLELNKCNTDDKSYLALEKTVKGLRTVKKDSDNNNYKEEGKKINTEILQDSDNIDSDDIVGLED